MSHQEEQPARGDWEPVSLKKCTSVCVLSQLGLVKGV